MPEVLIADAGRSAHMDDVECGFGRVDLFSGKHVHAQGDTVIKGFSHYGWIHPVVVCQGEKVKALFLIVRRCHSGTIGTVRISAVAVQVTLQRAQCIEIFCHSV